MRFGDLKRALKFPMPIDAEPVDRLYRLAKPHVGGGDLDAPSLSIRLREPIVSEDGQNRQERDRPKESSVGPGTRELHGAREDRILPPARQRCEIRWGSTS